MGSRLQCFFFSNLNLKYIMAKKHPKTSHIRSDQCIKVNTIAVFFSVFPHVWRFQSSNSLPSWESFWHSSTWKSSTEKQPDLYTFWSVHLRSNTYSTCVLQHMAHEGGWSAAVHISSAGQEKLGQELKQVKGTFGSVAVWFSFLWWCTVSTEMKQ